MDGEVGGELGYVEGCEAGGFGGGEVGVVEGPELRFGQLIWSDIAESWETYLDNLNPIPQLLSLLIHLGLHVRKYIIVINRTRRTLHSRSLSRMCLKLRVQALVLALLLIRKKHEPRWTGTIGTRQCESWRRTESLLDLLVGWTLMLRRDNTRLSRASATVDRKLRTEFTWRASLLLLIVLPLMVRRDAGHQPSTKTTAIFIHSKHLTQRKR